MKIFIICSKAFYGKIAPVRDWLQEHGFEVLLPHTFSHPEAEGEWYAESEQKHAEMKGLMFLKSRETISGVDAVLTLNFDKNGQKNYIGGSTFLELYEAFMQGKKIYLWNNIPEGMLKDEIAGFSPVIINGDLEKVLGDSGEEGRRVVEK